MAKRHAPNDDGETPMADIEIPYFIRDRRQPSPLDWLARHWVVITGLVFAGVTLGTMRGELSGKLNRSEYLTDRTEEVRANARRDSVAGQTLSEVKRIGAALCRRDPGAC